MLKDRLKHIWNTLLHINLYKKRSSNEQTAVSELLATRIYIGSLVVLLFAIGIAFIWIGRTNIMVQNSPSAATFAHLAQKYPNTLKCRCSKIGIAYGTFVKAHVHFHQVCSSQFVTQTWIDSVFINSTNDSSVTHDIRHYLSHFWQVVAGFCTVSNRTWIDAMATFDASHILRPFAAKQEVILNQAQQDLNKHISFAKRTLYRNLMAIQKTTTGSQFVSALGTNFYLGYPSSESGRWKSLKMLPVIYDNCSCLNMNGCPQKAFINDNRGELVAVPGMITDCLIVDATLASTLECYYDLTCFELLHTQSILALNLLSVDSNKRFSVNSTVQILLNDLMIDEVNVEITYESFYSQCSPSYCEYSLHEHFSVVFVATTIISIFGALSIVIRVTAPFIAKLVLRRRQENTSSEVTENNDTNVEHEHLAMMDRSRLLVFTIYSKMKVFNLFERKNIPTHADINREYFFTRMFIFALTICSIIIGLYIIISEQNQLITVENPSLEMYEILFEEYLTTIQCPCKQLTVPYGKLLNVTFILHQVCSSDLVSSSWLNYISLLDVNKIPPETETMYSRDFRPTGVAYFQLLAAFCSLAKVNIDDNQEIFMTTLYINDHLVPRALFLQQMQSMAESLVNETVNNFARMLDWINIAGVIDQFLTGINVNFEITLNSNNDALVEDTIVDSDSEINHNFFLGDSPCSCGHDIRICHIRSLLYTNGSPPFDFLQVFSEIPIGCLPLIGFFDSQIDWWYNESYIDNVIATYNSIIDFPLPPPIKALNDLIMTRFQGNTSRTLWTKMLMETSIISDPSYDVFYNQCAPISCSYSNKRHRDTFVIILLFISVCSGLNRGLRLLIPIMGSAILFVMKKGDRCNCVRVLPTDAVLHQQSIKQILKTFKQLNLYESVDIGANIIRKQRLYTRIYIILLVTSLGAVICYTALTYRTITKTYQNPSLADYEHLFGIYADALDCPCTKISILYGKVVSQLAVERFHEVCDTLIMETVFIDPFEEDIGYPFLNSKDFKTWSKAFVNSLAELCQMAKDSVQNSVQEFLTSNMLAYQVIPRRQFYNDINVTLERLKTSTSLSFARTLDLIRIMIHGNALLGLRSSNWKIVMLENNTSNNMSFVSIPVAFNTNDSNTTCSCATQRSCSEPAQVIQYNEQSFPLEGLMLGCFLLESTLRSSLSCFYSSDCIQEMRVLLGLSNYFPTEYWAAFFKTSTHLNATSTRYAVDDTIETLAYNMFIENWISNASYEMFFNVCAPKQCTSTYYYRSDALEILTTFLSVFTGLSLVLHFLAPYVIRMIDFMHHLFSLAVI